MSCSLFTAVAERAEVPLQGRAIGQAHGHQQARGLLLGVRVPSPAASFTIVLNDGLCGHYYLHDASTPEYGARHHSVSGWVFQYRYVLMAARSNFDKVFFSLLS